MSYVFYKKSAKISWLLEIYRNCASCTSIVGQISCDHLKRYGHIWNDFFLQSKIITMTWIFYFTFEKRTFENESPGKFLNSSTGEFPNPRPSLSPHTGAPLFGGYTGKDSQLKYIVLNFSPETGLIFKIIFYNFSRADACSF